MAAKSGSRWSGEVTKHSDALELENDVFKSKNPDAIAESLKHSADTSDRRKSSPYRSAMSMLTFYINRAGHNLSEPRRRTWSRPKPACGSSFTAVTKPDRHTRGGSVRARARQVWPEVRCRAGCDRAAFRIAIPVAVRRRKASLRLLAETC